MKKSNQLKGVLGKFFTVFILLTILMIPQGYSQQKIKVAFFIPHSLNPFWASASRVMRAACNDFNIELTTFHARGRRGLMIRQFRKAVKNPDQFDVLIFQSFKKSGEDLIKIGNAAKVKMFLFNAGVDYNEMGKPREIYKHWIGEMMPNDEEAGYVLANYLADEALRIGVTGQNGKVNMVSFSGILSEGAAIERIKGLKRAIAGRNDVNLLRTIQADWSKKTAMRKFPLAFRKFPETNIVWAANDSMGLGVIESSKKLNLKPGKNLLVGGVDWSPKALNAVKSGEMSISIGGHVLEAAWVIVLIYDYLNGIDFAEESVMMKSPMTSLPNDKIDLFIDIIETNKREQIDFRAFSKKFNPNLKKYDFRLKNIFDQFK